MPFMYHNLIFHVVKVNHYLFLHITAGIYDLQQIEQPKKMIQLMQIQEKAAGLIVILKDKYYTLRESEKGWFII